MRESTELSPDYSARTPDENDGESRYLWLISYSDFMTILMIFFLALYGYTHMVKLSLERKQAAAAAASTEKDPIAPLVESLRQKWGARILIEKNIDSVTLRLNEDVLFESGRADISHSAAHLLDELANSIKLTESLIVVQGHTDPVPIHSRRFSSNWELSAARAFAVIERLTTAGIKPQRLAAWGFGEHRPRVPNDSAENQAQNRRIEIVIFNRRS